uniref:HEPACAM family member 2 n=1 Tax=Lepisosteus oculatus TaxID=7918 RepID=W5MXQ0_LEPOC|nr:PREDICTED: HEPACAM family member 2 [Lepisosteus oculatus]
MEQDALMDPAHCAIASLLYKAVFVLHILSGTGSELVKAPSHINGTNGQPLRLPVEYNFNIQEVDIQGSWLVRRAMQSEPELLVTFTNRTSIFDMKMEYANKFSFHPPNASLQINKLDEMEEGEYKIIINIRFPYDPTPVTESKTIKVTVDVPVSTPVVHMTPTSEAVEDRDNVTLFCSVENGTRIQYQWLRDNFPVPASARHRFSQNHRRLFIAPVRKEDIGNYTCVVRNFISQKKSQPTVLNVFYGPYNLAVKSDHALRTGEVFTVDPEEMVFFHCWADSNPPNSYVWISKADNGTKVITKGPRFEVASYQLAHREDFMCRAYNNVTKKQDETRFTLVFAKLGNGKEKHVHEGTPLSPLAAITVASLLIIMCMLFVLFRKTCHPQRVIKNIYNRPLTEQKKPHLSGHEDATEDFGIYEFIAIPGKSEPTQASSRSLSQLDSVQDLHTTIYDVIRHIPETPSQGLLK